MDFVIYINPEEGMKVPFYSRGTYSLDSLGTKFPCLSLHYKRPETFFEFKSPHDHHEPPIQLLELFSRTHSKL
jgi:hypothetical protein